MEGKTMAGMGSKLKNLKGFLSSTRSLNQAHQSQLEVNVDITCGDNNTKVTSDQLDNKRFQGHYTKKGNNGGSGSGGGGNSKNNRTISLFNLMSGGGSSSSKKSACDKNNLLKSGLDEPFSSPAHKSISLYGLGPSSNHHNHSSHITHNDEKKGRRLENGYPSNSNFAARLFQNIRSKFRKRRRDRNNKIVDSKSTDFGSFLGADRLKSSSHNYSPADSENDRGGISGRSGPLIKSSVSVDNVLESFFGSRRRACSGSRSSTHLNREGEGEESPSAVMRISTSHPQYEEDEGDNNIYEESDSLFEDELSGSGGKSGGVVSVVEGTQCSFVPSPSKPFKCLTKELEDLLHYGWYWAGLSKEEAEAKLKGQPDGAFVVRDSSSDHYLLSLSFNSNGRCLHTRIEYRNGQFSFYSSDADSFGTVAQLIEHCIAFSELGVFCYSRARRSDYPSYPVRLTKPISRFTEVKSLVYLSRFVIRQYVRLDLIPHLPLPQTLIEFVSQQRYI